MSEPEPGPPLAHEVLRHATLGNARTAGLAGKLGAIKPGHKADLVLIDLNDTAYLPYNSAARQLVYTEAGRGVESVIVDGRVVMKDRKVTTIDEDALRREVAEPHAPFHRRLRRGGGVAQARAAVHAGCAPQGLGGRYRHEPLHRPDADIERMLKREMCLPGSSARFLVPDFRSTKGSPTCRDC